MIIPFVGIVTNPDMIQEQAVLTIIYKTLHFQSTTTFILFSVSVVISHFCLKNLYLLFFQYAQFKVILNQQVKLSRRLFEEYLTKPYTFHLQRNTADLLGM